MSHYVISVVTNFQPLFFESGFCLMLNRKGRMVMKKLWLLSALLMISNMSMAQVMLDQPCANGAGYIYKGRYSGEFCISKTQMTYWNAYAWCDAMGMRLIELNEKDCFSMSESGGCENIYDPAFPTDVLPTLSYRIWTAHPRGSSEMYTLDVRNGAHKYLIRSYSDPSWGAWAFCAPK